MMYFYYGFFMHNFVLFFFDANIMNFIKLIGLNKRILNKFKQ